MSSYQRLSDEEGRYQTPAPIGGTSPTEGEQDAFLTHSARSAQRYAQRIDAAFAAKDAAESVRRMQERTAAVDRVSHNEQTPLLFERSSEKESIVATGPLSSENFERIGSAEQPYHSSEVFDSEPQLHGEGFTTGGEHSLGMGVGQGAAGAGYSGLDEDNGGGDGLEADTPSELPELTVRSFVLVVLFSTVLGAANAYLGLFAGMTISVSIPSAILSLAVLSALGNTQALEVNAVQTGSSAGSSIASGVIYTLPGLYLIGYWDSIQYWETMLCALFGGFLGVLFSIPLRRALIVEANLSFPEGRATAEVLKVMSGLSSHRVQFAMIGAGALVGALLKLCDTGFEFWNGLASTGFFIGSAVLYFGCNLSPALLSVGYIIQLKSACLLMLGGVLNWYVAIPLVSGLLKPSPYPDDLSAVKAASYVWSNYTRYIGVGAMLLGGLGTVVTLIPAIVKGVKSGFQAYKRARASGWKSIPRVERDLPVPLIGGMVLVFSIALYFVFYFLLSDWGLGAFAVVFTLLAGFLFSAVGAYMAGIVGSSNNPVSGVTLATVITACFLLLAILGPSSPEMPDLTGPAAGVMIGAVVACAAAISGDNLQDLKAGHILGSTPYKQQLMQFTGIVFPSFVLGPVVGVLIAAYGIGEPTEEHPQPLPAPQATLVGEVAQGIFDGGIPVVYVSTGLLLAAAVMLADFCLYRLDSSFRLPVLAIALGLYLPLELATPIVLGGLINFLSGHTLQKWGVEAGIIEAQDVSIHLRRGLLFGAGAITGEALMGILLAIPIVISGNTDVWAFLGRQTASWPGLIIFCVLMVAYYLVVCWEAVAGKVLPQNTLVHPID